MTEDFKIYNVKVGTLTRAGNLNVLYNFVAKSNKKISDVTAYYKNKYKGLGCEVYGITEIVEDDIPKKGEPDYMTLNKNQALINEIDRLKKQSFNSFSGEIELVGSSPTITQSLKEMQRLMSLYKEEKKRIKAEVELKLKEKFNIVDINYITLDDFNENNSEIKYTIKLLGSLKYSDNNI